jgi:hypothetical protein
MIPFRQAYLMVCKLTLQRYREEKSYAWVISVGIMFVQLAGNLAQVGSFYPPVEHVIGIDVRLSLLIQPILSVFVLNHHIFSN